ncbi:MAG TPA: bL21 family ribosomal protein [Bryobacteraceae bacterium]|nr:bL21 family ribosomal protein [Bryobacteraceae bacterium]
MHAIIETGGKQFRVAPGNVVRVPKLAGDSGAAIALGKVLAVFRDGGESGELLTGSGLGDARVNATISRSRRFATPFLWGSFIPDCTPVYPDDCARSRARLSNGC